MFCPKCGCLLPDNATVCKECGCHISHGLRGALQEKQPTAESPRTENTAAAARYRLIGYSGTVVSVFIVLAFFLPWIVGRHVSYSGFDLLLHQPALGGSSIVFCTVPLFCALIGLAGTMIFLTGRRTKAAAFTVGALNTGLVVIFCVALSSIYGTAGLGVYLAAACGIAIIVLSMSDIGLV